LSEKEVVFDTPDVSVFGSTPVLRWLVVVILTDILFTYFKMSEGGTRLVSRKFRVRSRPRPPILKQKQKKYACVCVSVQWRSGDGSGTKLWKEAYIRHRKWDYCSVNVTSRSISNWSDWWATKGRPWAPRSTFVSRRQNYYTRFYSVFSPGHVL